MRNREFVFTPKIEYESIAERSETNPSCLQFLTWCSRQDASLSHFWGTHGFPIPSFAGKQMFSRPLSGSIPAESSCSYSFALCSRQDASLSHFWETHGFPIPSFTRKPEFPRPPSSSISADNSRSYSFALCSRQESNLHHLLRREVLYPFNYESVVLRQ